MLNRGKLFARHTSHDGLLNAISKATAIRRFRLDLPKMWSMLHNWIQENLPCKHLLLFHLGASADNPGMT